MIIPALDLSNGHVVRLKQGDFALKTVFNVDPIKRIFDAANQGAELVHIVDLDGAKDPVRWMQVGATRHGYAGSEGHCPNEGETYQ